MPTQYLLCFRVTPVQGVPSLKVTRSLPHYFLRRRRLSPHFVIFSGTVYCFTRFSIRKVCAMTMTQGTFSLLIKFLPPQTRLNLVCVFVCTVRCVKQGVHPIRDMVHKTRNGAPYWDAVRDCFSRFSHEKLSLVLYADARKNQACCSRAMATARRISPLSES